jgi:hypothetical protein
MGAWACSVEAVARYFHNRALREAGCNPPHFYWMRWRGTARLEIVLHFLDELRVR